MKNNLENLELKLLQTRRENAEKLDVIEAEYKKEYSDFFDDLFPNENLWLKRFISVSFQLEKLDNQEKNNLDILKNSIDKSLKNLPLNIEKQKKLENKLNVLLKKDIKLEKFFLKNTDFHKDKNFPILEDLEKYWVVDKEDLIKISLKYKETHNFLESISVLQQDKKEIIKSHFYELNNSRSEQRIENFQNDFKQEIDNSKYLQIYPKVLKFIWKNYSRLRLKNRVESKKDRLKRMFKIAFLKLYRLKYSWIDINSILNRIDSMDDLDEMINLLLKFFEQLKQNPQLEDDYIIWEEIEEVEELWIEAEENKEKILFSEKNTLKANEILEKTEKKLWEQDLENLLWDNVDLVWYEFVLRNSPHLASPLEDRDLTEEEDEELEEEIDLEEYYEELKLEYEELEKKKMKLFLEWNYDELDLINDELLNLLVKLEKIQKLLWFSQEWLE